MSRIQVSLDYLVWTGMINVDSSMAKHHVDAVDVMYTPLP